MRYISYKMTNHSRKVHTETERYGETLGVKLLRELAGRGSFIFTTEDAKAAAADLAIPETYLPQLLSRLAVGGCCGCAEDSTLNGEIARCRRGPSARGRD
jgi:hypothetical protein